MKKQFSIPVSKFTIDTTQGDLTPVRIQVCHDRENPNGSYFELESFDKAKESIKNKPIIAAYEINDEGEKEDFKGHEVEYKVIDEDGKIQFKEIYIEQPIGAIPETCDFSVKEIDGYNWVCVNGYLYNTYCSEAIEIIKNNDNTKKISMEIQVLDGYEDAKDGFYHIKDFKFLGVTVLGDEDMYPPAMGSNAELSLFTKTEQTQEFSKKFSIILDAINKKGGEKVGKKTDFSLSVNDLKDRIREELSKFTYTYTYYWGETDEYRQYYLMDVLPEEKIIVVEDEQDGFKNYGIPYSLNGDQVSLDMDNKVRYIRGDWRKFEGGEEPEQSETFSKILKKEQEYFENEIETIKKSFVATETEEYKKLKSDFEKIQKEKDELEVAKTNFEKQERERQEAELFEKFKDLETVEGFSEIKEKASEFSLEDLEKEFYVLMGKKSFSLNKIKIKEDETISLKVEDDSSNNELSEAEKRYGIGINK